MAWESSNRRPSHWPSTRRRIMSRDQQRCYLCGQPANAVDHIINLAAGGTESDDNLAAICKPCHTKKTQAEARAARVTQTRPPQRHPGLL